MERNEQRPLGVTSGDSVSRSSPDRTTAFAFVISGSDYGHDACGFDMFLDSAAICSFASMNDILYA